eukprot:SAG31_NODE_1729_length_7427_cov_1.746725_6_plen_179_part_00
MLERPCWEVEVRWFVHPLQYTTTAPGLPPRSWDLGASAEPLRAACVAWGRRRGAPDSNDHLEDFVSKLLKMRARAGLQTGPLLGTPRPIPRWKPESEGFRSVYGSVWRSPVFCTWRGAKVESFIISSVHYFEFIEYSSKFTYLIYIHSTKFSTCRYSCSMESWILCLHTLRGTVHVLI